MQASSIMKTRGRIYRIEVGGLEVEVLPTLHPAAALYNPRLLPLLESDFSLLRNLLRGRAEGLERFF